MIDVENLYHAIVSSSDDAIVAKDTDGIVLGWNAAAEQLFGWTAEEMIGQSIRRLLPPDRQDEEDRILERIRAGERVGQFFTERLHKSGEVREISVSVSPVVDASGKVVGASKIARDAGPYLDAQRRIAETQRQFLMLAENISQLAWIASGDGDIYWYNKRWFDYTGTSMEEMKGAGWNTVHHPDHVDRVTEHLSRCFATGEEWEATFPLRRHDGEWRWFLSRAKPIRDGGDEVEYWFGTNTDITEQREQAEQIRLLLMEVNHRSKNMLGTVQALARRTARGADISGPGGTATSDFIKRFDDRIRALALNQDILVRRQWRSVPLRELAGAQLEFVEHAPGIFTFEGPEIALAPRPSETIGMALNELATNALKYGALSVAGGHVDIGWSADREKDLFSMWWSESGGPPVVDNGRVGFGSTLIRDVPRHNLGAEVSFEHRAQGVSWRIECPLAAVIKPERD